MKIILLLAPVALLAACSPKPPSDVAPASASAESAAVSAASDVASSATVSVVDVSAFTGKWTGPEGTWLDIAPTGEAYRITVRNLDGPRHFEGTVSDGGIRFVRDGQAFVIRPGNGDATGMKWLKGKTDCLIVALGEGYCRG